MKKMVKNFNTFCLTTLPEFVCNHKFLVDLGSQSNPFQNLDKSAVLQEVNLIFELYFK